MPSTYPLDEIRALLDTREALPGVVVATRDGAADIATRTGLHTARVTGRVLRIGERVTLRDGNAYPRATADRRYPL
jgi:hypothetical protein